MKLFVQHEKKNKEKIGKEYCSIMKIEMSFSIFFFFGPEIAP